VLALARRLTANVVGDGWREALSFSPILKIDPSPTPAAPGFTWARRASRVVLASQSLTPKAIRLPRDV
jgi:hypothetical protein